MMKDSGVEWIGRIPEDWRCIKNKYLLSQLYSGGTPNSADEDCYCIENGVPFVSISDMSTTEHIYSTKKQLTEKGISDKNLKILHPGTILYSIYATIGAISELRVDATISQAILALTLNDNIFSQYYKFNLLAMRDYILSSANLNTQFNLNAEIVRNFILVCPPMEEQQSIASYLDKKCAEIDSIAEKTRESIEEYKKLKLAVITEAVTKGVRGKREMKDSGVEWIGEIPNEWNKIKIKWLLDERKERSVDGREEPLSMSQKYGLIPTKDMDMIPNMASSFVGAKLVHVGDLVFNKLKAHLGVFATSQYEGLVSPDYAVYHSRGSVDVKYLEYLFKTPQYINEFKRKSSGVGAGLTRLYTGDLYSIECSLPSHEEQEDIVIYINQKTAEIDSLIAKKEALLEELDAYKKSLIYEYVTGKKRVSETAHT